MQPEMYMQNSVCMFYLINLGILISLGSGYIAFIRFAHPKGPEPQNGQEPLLQNLKV